MQYLCVIAAVLTSGMSGYFYKRVSMVNKAVSASALLPIIWYLPLALVFGIVALGEAAALSAGVVLPALFSGVGAALCAVTLLEGMKRTAYSASVIIINLNFILPVLLSVFFLGEKTGWLQLAGMVVAAVAIVALNGNAREEGRKEAKEKAKRNPYILLAVVACIGNGILNFGIKLKQFYSGVAGDSAFYSLCYLFAAVLCMGAYAVMRTRDQGKCGAGLRRALPYALGIGACNGICFWAMGVAARYMNAAAEFTVITALSILVSLAVGRISLHEKLGKRGLLSLLFCAVAIVCQCFYLS